MISQTSALLKRIDACLQLDKEDPTKLIVRMDELIMYLHEYGYGVPPQTFENILTNFLNKYVVGKVELGHKGTMRNIAAAILLIAEDIIQQAENSFLENEKSARNIITDL